QPDHYTARLVRGQILAYRGETERAIADFDRAASAHPLEVEPTLLTWRGWCHSSKGDYQQAVADLTRAIEGFPVEIPVWIERARCYLEMGDLERARFDIDEILHLRPDDPFAHFLRFDLLSKRRSFGAAAAEAGRLRELLPDQPGPYLLRAVSRW